MHSSALLWNPTRYILASTTAENFYGNFTMIRAPFEASSYLQPHKTQFPLHVFSYLWICRKKWLPQQLRKLSHSKTDKLPVDKAALKKGSDKKSKVSWRFVRHESKTRFFFDQTASNLFYLFVNICTVKDSFDLFYQFCYFKQSHQDIAFWFNVAHFHYIKLHRNTLPFTGQAEGRTWIASPNICGPLASWTIVDPQ